MCFPPQFSVLLISRKAGGWDGLGMMLHAFSHGEFLLEGVGEGGLGCKLLCPREGLEAFSMVACSEYVGIIIESQILKL